EKLDWEGNSDSKSQTDGGISRWETDDGGGDGSVDISVRKNSLVNEDAREVIAAIKEEHGSYVDALITDPPYGYDYDARGDHDVLSGDEDSDTARSLAEEVIKQARLVLNEPAPVLVFCGDQNVGWTKEIVERWYNFEEVMVWDKEIVGVGATGKGDSRAPRWRMQHEFIVYGSYGKLDFQNENRHDGSILEFQRPSAKDRIHPTEKPAELMRYLVESVTEEGDIVFDPFAGSGATLAGAQQCGRNYVGAEIDEQHYEAARDRLEQKTLV
ncbi:MAG: site-specific DNA-methyltransferase, partial [Halobacteriaceae archaeon]